MDGQMLRNIDLSLLMRNLLDLQMNQAFDSSRPSNLLNSFLTKLRNMEEDLWISFKLAYTVDSMWKTSFSLRFLLKGIGLPRFHCCLYAKNVTFDSAVYVLCSVFTNNSIHHIERIHLWFMSSVQCIMNFWFLLKTVFNILFKYWYVEQTKKWKNRWQWAISKCFELNGNHDGNRCVRKLTVFGSTNKHCWILQMHGNVVMSFFCCNLKILS